VGIAAHKTVRVGQAPADVVERPAQICPGLGFGGIGPEKKGKPLPWLGVVAVEKEVGQQGLSARLMDGRYRFLVMGQMEPAE